MNARDVIAEELEDEFGHYADERADDILSALTAAGYRLIGPGELDRETIERCAAFVADVPSDLPRHKLSAALRSLQGGDDA